MKKILIGLLASLFLSSAALAGQFGIGVAGSLSAIQAEGKESDKDGTADTSMRTANTKAMVIIPSAFGEYSFDNGFTLGLDYVLGTADVSDPKLTRTDVTADAKEAVQDDGDRTASAEIENVITIYAEIPVHAGLYAKAGFVQMDVNTTESSTISTTATYGNTSVDGQLYGFGYKNAFGTNGFYKVEGTHTMMEGISLNGSTTDKGNKISADLKRFLLF